ncbi:MAG: DNA repair protein RecO [Patescibacteria group bacterium]
MDETRISSAIILNRSDYRESDSLVTVYTKEFGKLSLVARGTKKINSKLAGHLEPFSLVNILIIKGKGFDYIGSALGENAYLNLKDNLNKIYYSGRVISWFSRLVRDGERDERLFLLLKRWLEVTDKYFEDDFTKENGELFFIFFALKLMTELGYKPEMYECLNCRNLIEPGKNYFNLKNGGLVCGPCLERERKTQVFSAAEILTISDNCIKLMRFIMDNKLDMAKKLKLDKKVIKELSNLTTNFLNFHV